MNMNFQTRKTNKIFISIRRKHVNDNAKFLFICMQQPQRLQSYIVAATTLKTIYVCGAVNKFIRDCLDNGNQPNHNPLLYRSKV